jgi:photosystem II stability/assembly factor-like uncharacterized protein
VRSKPGIGGDFIRVLALLCLWGVLLSTTSMRASSQPTEPAWTKLTDPLAPGGYISALAQAPSNPQVLYTLLNNEDGLRVYRSQDGAASWNDLSTISGWVTKLSVDPGDAQTVYALSYSELLKSSDGGHSWSPIRTGVEAITVPLAGTIYAMVNATQSDPLCSSYTYDLLYSPDGGVTWLPLKQFCADHVQFIMADPSNPATMYITGVLFTSKDQSSAVAWKSTDSGTHWDPIPVIWEAGLTDFAIDADASQHLFVSGADGFFFQP